MTLTKQDIDALVDGLPRHPDTVNAPDSLVDVASFPQTGDHLWLRAKNVRRTLYLAAGLTAEGERKPERVRLWRGKSSWTGRYIWFEQEPKPDEFLLAELTPGWFVPDGAE